MINSQNTQQSKALQQGRATVPAEWARQENLWTCWPSHPDLWPGDLLARARGEIAAMVREAAQGVAVKVLADGAQAEQSAVNMLGGDAEIIPAKFGDIWLRDTGPIFNAAGTALRFRTNGWGGKYIYEGDDQVGDLLAARSGAKVERFDFILEGGALEHNGAGTILTTRQCLLNPNRNKGWDEAAAENALREAFGASRICWLEEGLLNDHTDGHIDNAVRFVSENHVVLQKAFGEDDPNVALYDAMARDLKNMGFDITQIPSPGKMTDELTGDICPASHMNFIITNGVVVVPTYGTKSADEAVAMLAELFPGRRVVGSSSVAVLTGGGSFHCITQQQPAKGA